MHNWSPETLRKWSTQPRGNDVDPRPVTSPAIPNRPKQIPTICYTVPRAREKHGEPLRSTCSPTLSCPSLNDATSQPQTLSFLRRLFFPLDFASHPTNFIYAVCALTHCHKARPCLLHVRTPQATFTRWCISLPTHHPYPYNHTLFQASAGTLGPWRARSLASIGRSWRTVTRCLFSQFLCVSCNSTQLPSKHSTAIATMLYLHP